ncbi:energy-coupling factor transporter transmembrane component T [Treponema pedis]|uniref:energy-coupling factor transporter transmembrane component T n=2 Tax=Treponema pedis TaxID=409322 RepID=UPI0003FE5239|nr:energy-coupling factor transporter transmembrane component T [Treponema pedis]
MPFKPFCIDDYINKKNMLDVRTLLIINTCVSVIMLRTAYFTVIAAAFILSFIIMLMFKMRRTAYKYLIAFLISFALSRLPNIDTKNIILKAVISFAGFAGFMNIKLFSFIMIAHIIIKKVQSTELIYALRKMKLHKGFILSLTVAFRFLPTAKKEFTIIKECMQMRGIESSFKTFFTKPLTLIEYSLVPLLFRSLKISEEMTAAALVKGVEYNGTKTSLVDVSLGKIDFFILAVAAALISVSYIYANQITLFFIESKNFLYTLIFKAAV